MNNYVYKIFLSLGITGAGGGILSFFTETTVSEIAELISAIFAAINIVGIIWFTLTKNKGEVKKLEAQGDSEIVDAAQVNLQGAKLVTTMLKEQIDDLRRELEHEKVKREEETERFERRIKEIEAQLRSYMNYASRLAAQVIEAGKIPEPLILEIGESDSLLDDLDQQQKKLDKVKGKRKEEIKNVKDNSKIT